MELMMKIGYKISCAILSKTAPIKNAQIRRTIF